MTSTQKIIFNLSLVLFILIIVMCLFARNGYGYMGYYGYHESPTFWYWNDTRYYYEKSARSGSVSGTNSRGGGPGQGK